MRDDNDNIFTRKLLGRLAAIGVASFVYAGFRTFLILAVGVYSLKYTLDHPELVVFVMMLGSWLGVWKFLEIADRWFDKRFRPWKS